MTDPVVGYDFKVIRTGSGKMDTTYSARACKPTELDKKARGTVDLEGMVRSQIKSYDELEELLTKYLNESSDSDEDEDKSPKKKDKDKKKKKKYKSDI